MAYFAELDENNIVLRVIVVGDSDATDENGNASEQKGIEFCQGLFGGNWKQTFLPFTIRKNHATVGSVYDEAKDAFIPPKPEDNQYGHFVFNEESCKWDLIPDFKKMTADTPQGPPDVVA
jgi:hypothetical protein